MCISLATAALVTAGVGAVATTVQQIDNARRERHQAADVAKAAAQVEARAAQSANATVAARRRALRQNSLLTGGGDLQASGMASAQRQTLGGP